MEEHEHALEHLCDFRLGALLQAGRAPGSRYQPKDPRHGGFLHGPEASTRYQAEQARAEGERGSRRSSYLLWRAEL